jgi:hypothetical protein
LKIPKGAFLGYEKGHRRCVIPTIANPASKASGVWRSLLAQIDHGAVHDGRRSIDRHLERRKTVMVRGAISDPVQRGTGMQRRCSALPLLSNVPQLFDTQTCQASLHHLRWKDRLLPCSRGQSHTVGPWGTSGLPRYRCQEQDCKRTFNGAAPATGKPPARLSAVCPGSLPPQDTRAQPHVTPQVCHDRHVERSHAAARRLRSHTHGPPVPRSAMPSCARENPLLDTSPPLERHNAAAPPVTWWRAAVPAMCCSPALGENAGADDGNSGSRGCLGGVLAW